MIDTLARHLAALREARRLLGMVLVNNPAFVVLGTASADAADPRLTGDPNYAAYQHIAAAINLLEPVPASPCAEAAFVPLCDRIAVLKPTLASVPKRAAGPVAEVSGTQSGARPVLAVLKRDRLAPLPPADPPRAEKLPAFPAVGEPFWFPLDDAPIEVLPPVGLVPVPVAAAPAPAPVPAARAAGRDEASVSIVCREAVAGLVPEGGRASAARIAAARAEGAKHGFFSLLSGR